MMTETSFEPAVALAMTLLAGARVDLKPLMDLTMGPLPAPQIHWNPIGEEFWLTWATEGSRIDVKLADREELRTLIRRALEAASEQDREAHAESRSG
jgi:hypothetical protein